MSDLLSPLHVTLSCHYVTEISSTVYAGINSKSTSLKLQGQRDSPQPPIYSTCSDIPQDSRRDFGTAARKEGQCQNPTLSEAANLCPARQHAAQNLFNISQHLQRRDTADNHSHSVKLLAINRPLRPINVSHLPSSKPQ